MTILDKDIDDAELSTSLIKVLFETVINDIKCKVNNKIYKFLKILLLFHSKFN